jgi:hypothetical protein
MFQLFNKDFFKFSFGFLCMIAFGLLGIVATGYLDDSQGTQKTASEKVRPETPGSDTPQETFFE